MVLSSKKGPLAVFLGALGAGAVAIMLAGCQAGSPPHCQEARATDVPLRFDEGKLIATTALDGQPTNMILDTGAQVTTLTKDAADRLSLALQALPGYVDGIGGSSGLYGFQAHSYQIGRLKGRDLRLLASDMTLSSGGVPVDGLLGVDFLAAYDVDLDLSDHKATLFRVLDGCRTPSTTLDGSLYVVPFSRGDPGDPRPYVNVQIGGKTLSAVIDSGAEGTSIFRRAAARLGLRIDELTADPHFRATGAGPRARAAVLHVMAPITIGELTLRNMPVAIIDQSSLGGTDMLIGLDFLFRVHAWFSFSSHSMILQYPPLPSPPDHL